MVTISCSGIGIVINGSLGRRNAEALRGSVVSLILTCLALLVSIMVSIDVAVHAVVVVDAETTATTSSKSKSTRRNLIINGENAEPSDHPFFVMSWHDAVRQTNDILCGASLIHSDIILTAAHCQGGFNYGTMAYDTSSGRFNLYKTVDLQIAHPDYYQNIDNINYDIMVMRLSSPITDVRPVLLNVDPDFPIKNINIDERNTDDLSLLEGLGVGLTESGSVSQGLKIGLFNPLTSDQCLKRMRVANVALTEDILCVDPSTDDSICSGDSGGPLTATIDVSNENIVNDGSPWGDARNSATTVPVQVGVVSFGNDCEADWVPDGFARVSYFHDWITKQICNYSRDPPADCSDYFQSEEYLELTLTTERIPLDKARMTLEFQHDFLAEQTVFSFRNTLTNEIAYVGPQYVPRRGELVVSTFLLPVPGNYALEVHDMGNDGLKNPDYVNKNYPQGNWTLSAEYQNGGLLEALTTGDPIFESLHTSQIRLPGKVPPPFTEQPSFSPTNSPTQSLVPTASTVHSTSFVPTTEEWGNATTNLADISGRADFGIASSGPPIYSSFYHTILLGLLFLSWGMAGLQ